MSGFGRPSGLKTSTAMDPPWLGAIRRACYPASRRGWLASSANVHHKRVMQTLITEFISLDGVVQAPGGPKEDTDGGFQHGGWSMKYFDPDVMGGTYDQLSKESDALLQGRRTYQVSAEAWPRRSGDSFSDWINSVQKYVVSDTLSEA